MNSHPFIQPEENIPQQIISAATEVHKTLGGSGLLETVYESALCYELELRGFKSERQLPVPVLYKSKEIRDPLFLDLLVEDEVVVEIKASGKDYPYYRAQLSTYLRLMEKKRGLIINFGVQDLSKGITHIINCT